MDKIPVTEEHIHPLTLLILEIEKASKFYEMYKDSKQSGVYYCRHVKAKQDFRKAFEVIDAKE